MYRNTYVEINEENIKHNIQEVKKKYPDYAYYIGVVKGNAYAHGSYIVTAMKEAGINYFATSSLEEAIEVRKYDKDTPILCLEPISPQYIEDILRYKVTVTIDSLSLAHEYSTLKFKGKLKLHLKLDTGMNRLGMKSSKEVKEVVSLFEGNNSFVIEGIYTHMATTGVHDFYFDKQVNQFLELTKEIDLKSIPIVHLGRSLTLVNHQKLDFVNGVRLGIILYGFNGSLPLPKGFRGYLREMKRNHFLKKYHVSPTTRQNDLKLKTAFSLYTEIMSIKNVEKKEVIGYGAYFKAIKNMTIAILPIGYADGMKKSLKYVAIGEKRYPIIDVCMDMTIIEIDSTIHLHDKVEIFGNTISIKEATRNIGENAYHLFIRITTRVPRVYKDKTEVKY